MTEDRKSDDPRALEAETLRTRRRTKAAIAFGVVMATLEMGVLLYMAYC